MVVFPRSRRHVRCLLALALLAWLMLAIAPIGAGVHMASAQQAATAGMSHGTMHTGDTGCCDEHGTQPDRHATQPCHCALPCAGVLPSMPAGIAAVTAIPARYAPPRAIEAPLSGFAPPLRPPLA